VEKRLLSKNSQRAVHFNMPGLLLSLLVAVLAPAPSGNSDESDQGISGCVVLLHGLGRTELSMKPLQWELSEAGYEVVNPSYPSLFYPIPELAVTTVEESIRQCRSLGQRQINFVTHSLGGILVREYLSHRDIPGLQRVVMLGPPNQGSEVADYVHSLRLLRPVTPVVIEQLGTGEQSIVRKLGPVNFELGVIAGTSNTLGFLPGFPEGDSDGTVTVGETVVIGMQDFLELPVSHTFMIWDRDVIQQVVHFLRNGKFYRSNAFMPNPGTDQE
jgi:triacylglycerol lipase